MPSFELVLLIRKLERLPLKEALKRGAGYIFESGGTLRTIDNLGFRNLPYVIKSKGKKHIHAHCFVFNFDSGLDEPQKITNKFNLDVDVVRATNLLRAQTILDLHTMKTPPECTVQLDQLPPPSRPNVVALQELANKKKPKHNQKNFEDKDFLIF